MLTTVEQLRTTQQALADLEVGLAELQRKRDTLHPNWFRITARPFVDQICALRQQIDEYIGLRDQWLAEELPERKGANGAPALAEPTARN